MEDAKNDDVGAKPIGASAGAADAVGKEPGPSAAEAVHTSDDAKKPSGPAELIETWFRDHFNGSSILADTTDRYNAAYAAKEDLKKRLAN